MNSIIDIPYRLIREKKMLAIHVIPDTSVIIKSPNKTNRTPSA